MRYRPDEMGRCQHCDKKLSMLYQITHPETITHWRCLQCFRELVSQGKPVVVTGVQLPSRSNYQTNINAAGKAARAADEALGLLGRATTDAPPRAEGGE